MTDPEETLRQELAKLRVAPPRSEEFEDQLAERLEVVSTEILLGELATLRTVPPGRERFDTRLMRSLATSAPSEGRALDPSGRTLRARVGRRRIWPVAVPLLFGGAAAAMAGAGWFGDRDEVATAPAATEPSVRRTVTPSKKTIGDEAPPAARADETAPPMDEPPPPAPTATPEVAEPRSANPASSPPQLTGSRTTGSVASVDNGTDPTKDGESPEETTVPRLELMRPRNLDAIEANDDPPRERIDAVNRPEGDDSGGTTRRSSSSYSRDREVTTEREGSAPRRKLRGDFGRPDPPRPGSSDIILR